MNLVKLLCVRRLALDQFMIIVGGGDGDGAGLHGFWQFTQHFHMQQAIGHFGILNHDVIGQLETPFEIAGGDATVQIIVLFFLCAFLALDAQYIFFDFDIDFVFGKAGNGHGQAIFVFLQQLDIKGRVIAAIGFRAGADIIEHVWPGDQSRWWICKGG